MNSRVLLCSVGAGILVTAAELVRRLCRKKIEQAGRFGVGDGEYNHYKSQISFLHPVALFLSLVCLSPLLAIPFVLEFGRRRLVGELGIAALVAIAFWVGKHVDVGWFRTLFIDSLTVARGAVLAIVGLFLICCAYFLVSDPKSTYQEIRHELSKGEKNEH